MNSIVLGILIGLAITYVLITLISFAAIRLWIPRNERSSAWEDLLSSARWPWFLALLGWYWFREK